jgi:predicted esterase
MIQCAPRGEATTLRRFAALLGALLSLTTSCGDDAGSGTGAAGAGAAGAGAAGGEGPTTGGAGGAAGGAGGAGGLGGGLPGGPSSERLTARPLGTVPGAGQGFWEYLPPGYGSGADFPLLVFFHGLGENGDGSEGALASVLVTGLPALLANDQWPENQPFVILSTQHPGGGCHTEAEIASFLAFATESYDIDPKRVYLTGLSCGAIGAWSYLGVHTDEVAAGAVLIAGSGTAAFAQAGCDLGTVPIWAFHGDADDVVSPSGSIDPIESLQACTNPPAVDAKLTLYPGVGHNSWDMTYDPAGMNDIYTWLLSHEKP